MTTENASQERGAAELLLAVAIKERDDAQARIDWLSGLVARYKGGAATGQPGLPSEEASSKNGVSLAHDEIAEEDESTAAGPLYGKVRAAVHQIFLDALPRKLTMAEATTRFERLGLPITAKTAVSSVRHGVRGLVKTGKLRKIGNMHYKAVTES